ncbi:MAG TPA: hypothetical protein VMC86_00460 [Gemmatimonadales bacterium]|nr:hypothetical protein [Gemmatimonadales bacterium]
MRRLGRLVGIAGLIVIAGCHSSTAANGPFSGHWVGQDVTGTINLDLNLTDASDGSVTGSGSLSGSAISGGDIPLTVSGTESAAGCAVTLDAPPYTHADLSGQQTNGTWSAVLNGSGFVSVSVTLRKQAH